MHASLRLVRVAACVIAWAAVAPLVSAQGPPAGPLPNEALSLPADVGLLLGLDVKAFVASAEYKLFQAGEPLPGMQPAEQAEMRDSFRRWLGELEAKTGISPERDVDRIVAGFGDFGAKDPRIGFFAIGRLDAARITSAFTSGLGPASALERKSVGGRTLLLSGKGGNAEGALAFLGERAVLFGQAGLVEATLRNVVEGRRPLEGSLASLVRRLDPASSLFVVVGPSAAAAMRKGAGAQPPPFPIPDTLSLSSNFAGSFELIGEMPDESTARNMADLVRGGLAGLRMQLAQGKQTAQPAEMNRMLDGIQVTAEGKRARLFAPGPSGGGAAVGMIAAIAIPSLLRARVAANEAGVIGDIRTVISAEAAYQPAGQGYGSLSCLSKPGACVKGYAGPAFLDEQLAAATDKTGYKRAFHPGPAGKRPATFTRFAYTATPLEPGRTGMRSFCGDSTGRICFDPKGSPIVPAAGACPQACADLK